MFKAIAKMKRDGQLRRNISDYLFHLRPALGSVYGKEDAYTPEQIMKVIKTGDFNVDDACYALAIWCSSDVFAAYHKEAGQSDDRTLTSCAGHECSFWELREKIAKLFFNGNVSFNNTDIERVKKTMGVEPRKETSVVGSSSEA